MYQNILVFFAAMVYVNSAPVNEDAQARILQYEFYNDGSGNYNFSYETSNGLKRQEIGKLVNVGTKDEHIVVRGFFSYIDADGNFHKETYTADENGYQQSPFVTKPAAAAAAAALPYVVIASMLG